MFGLYPLLMKLYADGGYQGPLFRRAVATITAWANVGIVKRSDHAKRFVVVPSGGSSNERSHGSGGAGASPKRDLSGQILSTIFARGSSSSTQRRCGTRSALQRPRCS